MSTLEELVVRIKADASQLERELKKASASTEQTAKKMGSAMDSTKQSVMSLKSQVAALAGFLVGGKFVGTITSFEKIDASLRTVTGSAENAAGAFDLIQRFAATTPFSVQEVADAFIKLTALGLTPSEEALRSYGNTASAMGKSLNQMIEAVADAATGEFERLKEFGIRSQDAGDSVKFTFQGITTTVKKNAADIEDYLRSIGDVNFGDAMKEQQGTLNAALSNMGDSFSSLAKTIGDAGITDLLIDITKKIQNLAKTAADNIPKVALGIKAIIGGIAMPFLDDDVKQGMLEELSANADQIVAGAASPPAYKPKKKKKKRNDGSFGKGAGTKKSAKKQEAKDYDAAGDAISEYLDKQQQEIELAGLSGKAQSMRAAELQAASLAIKENSRLTDEQREAVRANAAALYDAEEATRKLSEAQQEAIRFNGELKDKFSDALGDIAFDFENAADAASKFAESLARLILQKKVAGPLADSIIGALDSSGITSGVSSLFGLSGARASGGPVGGGQSYLVGERGPEIFTPSSSGFVSANNQLGGGGVTVVQHNTFGSGVTRAEVAQMLPAMVNASKTAVFDAIQKGGAESRLIGRRS